MTAPELYAPQAMKSERLLNFGIFQHYTPYKGPILTHENSTRWSLPLFKQLWPASVGSQKSSGLGSRSQLHCFDVTPLIWHCMKQRADRCIPSKTCLSLKSSLPPSTAMKSVKDCLTSLSEGLT